MKRLRYDIIEGFDKGVIDAYENDNNTEIYKISLLKDRFRNIYDLTGKSIKMCLMNPNDKSGTIINIEIEDRIKGLIQLPIKSEITLKNGTYLCQFTITGINFKQTTKIFTINIKNNLFNDLSGAIEEDERFPVLEGALNRLDALEAELDLMINTLETKLPELQNALDDIAEYLNFTGEIKKARRNYPDIDTRIMSDIGGVNENLEKFSYIQYESQNIQAKNTFNGYTKEMIIKGLTLQNLHESKTTLENESKTAIYSRTSTRGEMFSKGLYTFKNDSGKIINISIYSKENNDFVKNVPISVTQILDIQENEFVKDIVGLYSNGWRLEDKELFQKQCIVLKGDHSNKEIPSYFEGVKSVGELEGNKISILSHGKNIFNGFDKDIWVDNVQLKKCTFLENSILIKDLGYQHAIKSKTFSVKKGETYNLSFTLKKNTNNEKIWIGFYFEGDSKSKGVCYDQDGTNNFDWIPNENYNDVTVRIYNYNILSEWSDFEISELQALNSSYSKYDKYKEDKKEISLPFEGGLKSLPNGVSDEIKNSIIQKVTKLKLDNTIDWQINDTSKEKTIRVIWNQLTPKPITKKDNTNLLCDKFPVKYNYNSDEEGLFINSTGELYNSIYLRINKVRLKTPDINGFKEWIRNNNLVIQYELLNYNIYEFDANIDLQTFKYVTYISSKNAIKPNISCKVLSNIPSVISELNEENARLRQNESILKDGQITLANTLIGALEAVALSLDDSEIMKENEQIIALQELILKLQNMR